MTSRRARSPDESSGRGHGAYRLASPSDVTALVARAMLGSRPAPERLGTLTLLPHQQDAALRARAAIAEYGGVLVADAVGLGKTFTGLAAVPDARHLLVAAPAALREMWQRALGRAARVGRVVSFESLSRAARPGARTDDAHEHDALIVDEAHHARTPGTRRYDALAALATGVPVVLVSATPVHNRPRDLRALLALFLGARAEALRPEELARLVIRRTRASDENDPRPMLARPVQIRPPADEDVLRALLAIPPPVPARDGAAATALVRLGLVRQWASTDAALRAALGRRLAAATAMTAALDEGRHPTRAELSAFAGDAESVQLVLVPLVIQATTGDDRTLRAAVLAHADGIRRAFAALGARDDPDVVRAARLRALWQAHAGVPIVAFSQYAATIRAYWRELRRWPEVCAVTAEGAIVAGGRMTRVEALKRFAPRSNGVAPPRAGERISLLLTTDLLSEGLDLQDAGVVVHLDLPWTPARLAQRVGRVRRIGSAHARVATYYFMPPVPADRWARLTSRLADKARGVRREVGCMSPANAEERCRRLLARWLRTPTRSTRDCGRAHATSARVPRVAVLVGERAARLALVGGASGRALLLATRGGGAYSADPRSVLAVLRRIDDARRCPDVGADPLAPAGASAARAHAPVIARELRRVRALLRRRLASREAGIGEGGGARVRARLLAHAARVLARAPRSRRAHVATIVSRLRAALDDARGAGAERALTRALPRGEPDEQWLAGVASLTRTLARRSGRASVRASRERVVALIVVEPRVESPRAESPGAGLMLPRCRTAPPPPSSSTSTAP